MFCSSFLLLFFASGFSKRASGRIVVHSPALARPHCDRDRREPGDDAVEPAVVLYQLDARMMAGRGGKAFVAASGVAEASTTIIDDRVRRGPSALAPPKGSFPGAPQTGSQLIKRRPLGHPPNLAEQVVGQ